MRLSTSQNPNILRALGHRTFQNGAEFRFRARLLHLLCRIFVRQPESDDASFGQEVRVLDKLLQRLK